MLDQLINSYSLSGSSILRIFEAGDSSKVNYYTFGSFAKRTTPTNTDAIFSSLTYLGGSGTTTFAKPCLAVINAPPADQDDPLYSSVQDTFAFV